MAIRHHHHYEHRYEDFGEPASSMAAFAAALAMLVIVFLAVVLLWAPWGGNDVNSTAGNPSLTQPVQVQPAAPAQPQGGAVQTLPSAPQNPGSTAGR